MATEREKLLNTVNGRLWGYAGHVKAAQGKLSDGAEELFRGLLDRMLGCKLQNMNREKKNFPGIDLGDDSEGVKLCVQVTSDGTRDKVKHTLKEFFEEKLHERFGRLIVLVVGNAQKFTGEPEVKYGFDFQTKRDIWDTARLVQEIEALDDDRLESVAKFLKEQLQDYRWGTPEKAPLDLPLRTAMDERNFVGRESELAKIAKRFETDRIVVLSGLGGMGKTELAVRFGRDYANSGRGRAYFVNFRKDFFHTVTDEIALGIEGLTEQKLDEDAKFRAAMKVLNKCAGDDLLILDNADTEEGSFEQLRRELSVLPMRILITTRCDAVRAIDVAALHREELHRIFRLYAEGVSEADMDALIDAVDAHTLTVDLMARSMRPGRRATTPEKMLNALNKRDLTSESFMKVATNYPGDLKQARINEHLRTVFKVAELSDVERTVLCWATLLPPRGMYSDLFSAPLVEEAQDALDKLINRGWVVWNNDLLLIHPVIRIVCREELKPSEENCGRFLMEISNRFDPDHYSEEEFQQYGELFWEAASALKDTKMMWLVRWAFFFVVLWKKEKRCPLPDTLESAETLEELGSACVSMNSYKDAKFYYCEVVRIREKLLSPDNEDLLQTYIRMGIIYGALGESDNALEYLMKALKAKEARLPSDHPDIAEIYNCVAMAYGDKGNYTMALDYQLAALTIFENQQSKDCGHYERCLSGIAITYARMEDFAKALEFADRALEEAEQSMKGQPDLNAYHQLTQRIKLHIKMRELGKNPPNPFK